MTALEDQVADLNTHHIEGIAHQGYTPFSVPLISHIGGDLWTGGCRDGVRLPDDFKHVVSLYPWERYELGPDTERVEVKLYDSARVPDTAKLRELAGQVNDFLLDGKTLVHCQAGLNRSALVAAMALITNSRDPLAPADAIAMLRNQRSPAVLCNQTFERFLLDQASD